MFIKTLALSGLATLGGNAHMLMTNPVPYDRSQLDNGPLKPDGSDFPCKHRADVYNPEGASNVYKQGSTQQLVFKGSAVHGGGSCQVSVTTDVKPSKNSVWRVIKSIEGGCPAKDQAGNMGSNANAEDPYKYDFTIPNELAAGNYTLAWTWFNRIGNPEMYMNCAPMTVTGSAGSEGFMGSLPNMFVANLGNNCETTQQEKNLLFPNPGKNVERFNGAGQAFTSAVGAGCQQRVGGGGSDYGDSPAPSGNDGGSYQTPGASPDTSSPTTDVVSQATSAASGPHTEPKSIPGGVFLTVTTKGPAASSAAPSVPAPSGLNSSQPAVPAPTAPATSPSPGTGGGDKSSGGHPAGTACSLEGAWNCIGGTSFQRCASGTWSRAQALAAGVGCDPGESSEMKTNARTARRVMRRALRFGA